jgi:hypothetical protein
MDNTGLKVEKLETNNTDHEEDIYYKESLTFLISILCLIFGAVWMVFFDSWLLTEFDASDCEWGLESMFGGVVILFWCAILIVLLVGIVFGVKSFQILGLSKSKSTYVSKLSLVCVILCAAMMIGHVVALILVGME